MTAKVSTLGLGLEFKYPFHEKFNARLVVNKYDKSYSKTDSGNNYKGDLELSAYGLIGDWHPTGNGFRLSAGLYSNGNELKARTVGNAYKYNNQEYAGAASVTVDFKSLAPYVGLGWVSQKQSGWSFDFEIGALFQGEPMLSGRGNATVGATTCNFSVNDKGVATVTGGRCDVGGVNFKDNIEAEHQELEDDLDRFKVYPVLSFGVQYRF